MVSRVIGRSICPRDSGSPPQEFLLGSLGEAILNLKGQIDLPITRGTSHYLFYYTLMLLEGKNDYFNLKLISSTMGLVTKKTHKFE